MYIIEFEKYLQTSLIRTPSKIQTLNLSFKYCTQCRNEQRHSQTAQLQQCCWYWNTLKAVTSLIAVLASWYRYSWMFCSSMQEMVWIRHALGLKSYDKNVLCKCPITLNMANLFLLNFPYKSLAYPGGKPQYLMWQQNTTARHDSDPTYRQTLSVSK